MRGADIRLCRFSWSAIHFFQIWLLWACLCTLLGLLAVRFSAGALACELRVLCGAAFSGSRFSGLSLLLSASFFFLLILISSLLTHGVMLVMLAVGLKVFSAAYVFGAYYLLRQEAAYACALLPLCVHSLLLLPALYILSLRCCRFGLRGGGRAWFRYRLLPLLLIGGYLALISWLCGLLWTGI